MPRANWGVTADQVDEFDRDAQFKPYTGPVPASGVYLWQVKVLKFAAGTREKNPQLRVGLSLVPREGYKEERYEGYFIMDFAPVSEKTDFRYVPFLDAIGVSGREFEQRTILDEAGNIKKIGRWRNDGNQLVAAQLMDDTNQNGEPTKKIGWYGSAEDLAQLDDDDDNEEEFGEDEYEFDED